MTKFKALVVALVVGSSSVAMAAPATFSASARASVSFNVRTSNVRTPDVVVRDHRGPSYQPVSQRPRYQPPVYQPAYDDDHCDTSAIAGSYTSVYGPVQLVQRGDRITGTFTAGGGGTIEGRIVGNQIIFTWKNTAERGRGVWYIANTNRIDGTWGQNASQTDGGAWNLVKRA